MRKSTKLILASVAAAVLSHEVGAATITLNKSGFADLSGGQVAGYDTAGNTGTYFTIPIGSDASTVNFPGLVPGNTYSVDFFHNSGALGSDFSFTLDGGGAIASITTGGGGANPYVIATGATTSTLTLQTHSVTYNANGGQKGNYYIQGLLPAQGNFSAPATFTAIPGLATVDNLYNPGQFTEDFSFVVTDTGTTSYPGAEQFANFSGNNVSPTHIVAHFNVVADHSLNSIFGGYQQPLVPGTAVVVQNGPTTWEYNFDVDLTPGNNGASIVDFYNQGSVDALWNQLFVAGDALRGDGSPWTGNTVLGDVPWAPKLFQAGDLYYFVTTGGLSDTNFNTIVGTHDDGSPMTVTITATLVPEPASLGLLALGGLLMLKRRRLA